jgi:hypothetical protein
MKPMIKNEDIIKGTYYYGKNLPPQLNTPSALKISKNKIF